MYPIGTVLSIKGNENMLMIVGVVIVNEQTGMKYEYAACKYPFGVIGETEYILFNKENIEKVYHMGLESENHNEFVEMSKIINHFGEYEDINYEIKTYDKFLEVKEVLQQERQSSNIEETPKNYTEL